MTTAEIHERHVEEFILLKDSKKLIRFFLVILNILKVTETTSGSICITEK